MSIDKNMNVNEVSYLDEATFEIETNTLKNLKLIGFVSQNNRKYEPKALQEGAGKYANKPVYIDHKPGIRSYADRIATIVNPRFVENDGIRCDMVVNPKHAMTERVTWDFQNNVSAVGLSHGAYCESHKEDGVDVITRIDSVKSVDLVADPATTKSLKEQTEQTDALKNEAVEEIRKELNELKASFDELKTNMSKEKPVARMVSSEKNEKPSVDTWLKKITTKY